MARACSQGLQALGDELQGAEVVDKMGGALRSILTLHGSLGGRAVDVRVLLTGDGQHDSWITYRAVAEQCLALTVTSASLKHQGFAWLERRPGIGDPRLERKFGFRGVARHDALRVFRQKDLERPLDYLFSGFGLSKVSIGEGLVRVQEPLQGAELDAPRGSVRPLQVLRSLCLLAAAVERQAVSIPNLGVRFVVRDSVGKTRCPYCHDQLDVTVFEPLVACVKCDTVHHADCFREASRCTIFGCDSRRARGRRG